MQYNVLVMQRKRKPSKKEREEFLKNFQYIFLIFAEKDHERVWIFIRERNPEFALLLCTAFYFRQAGQIPCTMYTRKANEGKGLKIVTETLSSLHEIKEFQRKKMKIMKEKILANIQREIERQKRK